MSQLKEKGEADLKGTMFEAPDFVKHDLKHGDHHCMNMEDDNDDVITTSESSSMGDSSRTSASSDLVDDASSPPSISNSSSSTICQGPLFELSELMAELPIKRGLSKYFKGKSQSFTSSLSSVKTIGELAKKETPFHRKKIKARKSYRGGSDAHKSYSLPVRPTISKKVSTHSSSFFGRKE